MNYYTKLIARTTGKLTGRPAVLSPLLDNYCGWKSMKRRFSSKRTKYDYMMILKIEKKQDEDSEKKIKEYDGHLKIGMEHSKKKLWENNLNWSRDSTYEFSISSTIAPLVKYLAFYWIDESIVVSEDLNLENPLTESSRLKNLDHFEFRVVSNEVRDALEPDLSDFLNPLLNVIKKKYNVIAMYYGVATEVLELNDVLSSLECIPLWKKLEMEFQEIDAETAAGQSSQEDSGAETSPADSKGSKSAKPKETVTTKLKKRV